MGNAENIGAVRLYCDGTLISSSMFTNKKANLHLSKEMLIYKDTEKEMIASVDLTNVVNETTIGIKILNLVDVVTDKGAISLTSSPPSEGDVDIAYVNSIPEEIRIDGAFADWEAAKRYEDADDDSNSNQNIDIRDYRVTNNTLISFYLMVDGEMIGGAKVPFMNTAKGGVVVEIDSDRDTVPDIDDPYPYDFNNDGTPDVDTDHDVDEDIKKDYPHGYDQWLNTTIPGDKDFPPQYANKSVSVYIGPTPEAPVVKGNDVVRIYIDGDNTSTTGCLIGAIGADHLVQIEGKYGVISNKSLYRYNASTAQWTWIQSIAAACDSTQLEAQIDAMDITGEFRVYFETTDWKGDEDDAYYPIDSIVEGKTRHYKDANGGYGLFANYQSSTGITIDGKLSDWPTGANYDYYATGDLNISVFQDGSNLYVGVNVTDTTYDGSGDESILCFDIEHNGVLNDGVDWNITLFGGNTTSIKSWNSTSSAFDKDKSVSSEASCFYWSAINKWTWEYKIALADVYGAAPINGEITGFIVRTMNQTSADSRFWPYTVDNTADKEKNASNYGDLFYNKTRFLINEVASAADPDWIELYNGGDNIDLNGISITDQDEFTWTSSSLVFPNDCYLLLKSGSGTDDTDFSDGTGTIYIGATDWNDVGDDVLLVYGGNGCGIDYMQYGSGSDVDACPSDTKSDNSWTGTSSAPGASESLGRDSSSTDTDTSSDWHTYPNSAPITPGGQNIPEFSHVLIPIAALMIFYIITRRKRMAKSEKVKNQ
jgi:hypothetical protein